MSPELIVQLVQLGAIGLLAFVLYFGLQANARMIEIMSNALSQCQRDNHELQMRVVDLINRLDSDEFPRVVS